MATDKGRTDRGTIDPVGPQDGMSMRSLATFMTGAADPTRDQIESSFREKGYREKDVRAMGRAWDKIGSRDTGRDFLLQDDGFVAVDDPMDGGQPQTLTGSGRRKGNLKGFDLGDLAGVGRGVSLLAGGFNLEKENLMKTLDDLEEVEVSEEDQNLLPIDNKNPTIRELIELENEEMERLQPTVDEIWQEAIKSLPGKGGGKGGGKSKGSGQTNTQEDDDDIYGIDNPIHGNQNEDFSRKPINERQDDINRIIEAQRRLLKEARDRGDVDDEEFESVNNELDALKVTKFNNSDGFWASVFGETGDFIADMWRAGTEPESFFWTAPRSGIFREALDLTGQSNYYNDAVENIQKYLSGNLAFANEKDLEGTYDNALQPNVQAATRWGGPFRQWFGVDEVTDEDRARIDDETILIGREKDSAFGAIGEFIGGTKAAQMLPKIGNTKLGRFFSGRFQKAPLDFKTESNLLRNQLRDGLIDEKTFAKKMADLSNATGKAPSAADKLESTFKKGLERSKETTKQINAEKRQQEIYEQFFKAEDDAARAARQKVVNSKPPVKQPTNTLSGKLSTQLTPSKYDSEIKALEKLGRKRGVLSDGTQVRLKGKTWEIYKKGGKFSKFTR